MKGTQGGAVWASTCLYFVKFLLESMMALQASNCNMKRWLTCSHVRFRRRIGGVFNPEIIAAMLEKLLRPRQRYNPCKLTDTSSQKMAHVCNQYEVFDDLRSAAEFFSAQNRIGDPVGDLNNGISSSHWRNIRNFSLRGC